MQIQGVVEHLQQIIVVLQNYPNPKIDIEGDTHHIGISGDYQVIKALVDKELVSLDYFWD